MPGALPSPAARRRKLGPGALVTGIVRGAGRLGVQEVIVWRTRRKRIGWFDLSEGEYRPLPPDRAGIIRCRTFPGLRLAAGVLPEGDPAGASAEPNQGVQSSEHREFAARPAART